MLVLAGTVCLHADDVVVRPLSEPGPLDNPLKGWCPYTDAGEIHQPYSMVLLYVPWSELEPRSGDYRFDAWEKSWNVDAAKGKHIIFRVYIDYPSLPSGLPTWLRKAGVKETAYKEHGGGASPDYNDPKMVAAMERLVDALGQALQQPLHESHSFRWACLASGASGTHGLLAEMYASTQTERRIIDAYRRAFPDKSLMVRYARDYAGGQPWIGFHDDMFPEDTDNGKDWSFLSGLRKSGRTDNWKVAVVGGEMMPNQAKRWLSQDYETTMTMLERAHFTWVGPYCPPLERSSDEEFRRRSQALVRRMGYEFQLNELRHPGVAKANDPIDISLKGQNNGVAPFYYPWSVEWALIDTAGSVITTRQTPWDVRHWKPGSFAENAEVAFDVRPGDYRLALGIRDPWRNRPAIRFANQLQEVDGWAVLSKLKITQ